MPTFHAEVSAIKYYMFNDWVLTWRKRTTYRTSAESHGDHPRAARSWRSAPDTRDTWEHLGPSCAPVPGNGRIHERPRQTGWCLKAARKNIQDPYARLCPRGAPRVHVDRNMRLQYCSVQGKCSIQIRADRGFFIHCERGERYLLKRDRLYNCYINVDVI